LSYISFLVNFKLCECLIERLRQFLGTQHSPLAGISCQTDRTIEMSDLQGARLLLAIAAVNAATLSLFAVASAPDAAAQLRALAAGAVATIPSGAAFWYSTDMPALLKRDPWLPIVFAGAGALMLTFAHDSASTLVAAYMTPVGICSLLARWRSGIATAAVLGCGYAGSLLLAPHPPSPEVAVSNVLPGFIVVLGAVLPIRLLFALHAQQATDRDAVRANPELRPWEEGRPALARGWSPHAQLMPPRKAPRGRQLGERPEHSVKRENELIALLRRPGPIPSAVELARSLNATAGVIRAQLREMRRRAGYTRHVTYVASLRADQDSEPDVDER
jgi:hypothetical protein